MTTLRDSIRILHLVNRLGAVILMLGAMTAIVHVFGSRVVAQQAAGNATLADIDELVKAEADLERVHSNSFYRNDSNRVAGVDRRLRSILQRSPDSPFRFQIEEDLRSVGEILAQHDLAIATAYLNKARQSTGGLKGAQGRLLGIAQKYPRFSQMDEVLLMLAEVSIREECPDDALAYLRKLISDYPLSSRVGSAIEKLNEIPLTSSESRHEPESQ